MTFAHDLLRRLTDAFAPRETIDLRFVHIKEPPFTARAPGETLLIDEDYFAAAALTPRRAGALFHLGQDARQ